MVNDATSQPAAGSAWQAKQVYGLAVACLVIGVAIGFLFRGSQSPSPSPRASSGRQAAPAEMSGQMPSLEQMKQMADTKAAPLLEKLKADPQNRDLLAGVGNIYGATHQFKEAIRYYDQALAVDPKNVPIRTQMASCMYYSGDADEAIAQLQQALQYAPKDANSLFNLGMIKWQGKQDAKGALAAWRELLKSNPQLSAERKAQVERLIADAEMHDKS